MISLRFTFALLLAGICSALASGSDPSGPPEFQGVLIVGSERRFALVAPGGEHSGWISVGASFAGWKLLDYRAAENAIVLGSDDRKVTVPLRASVVHDGETAMAARATVAEADGILTKMKFEAMWDRIVGEQKKAILGGMRQQATAEFAKAGLRQDEIDGLLDRMSDAVVSGMQSDAMRKDFAQIYADVYTKDELRGMADFYDTAVGQAWVEKQPEVQQKLMQALMPRVMEGMPAAQKIAAEYLQQRASAAPAPKK